MGRLVIIVALLALLPASISGTALAAPEARSYLVIADSDQLPADFSQQIASAGGVITATIPEIGVAVVSAASPSFKAKAARISGIQSVVPNLRVNLVNPVQTLALDVTNRRTSSAAADYSDLQWGLAAVGAPAAWSAGYRGAGVRIAVLDDGIAPRHPDLAPNLNIALSTSFVPDETFAYVSNTSGEVFNHGAHVAGTIAAADNGAGVTGVAPDAELVMVKVASSATGSGTWDGVIQGIVYAASIDADIINMGFAVQVSLRGSCDVDGECATAREIAEIAAAFGRATTYAYDRGTTIIAAAGDDRLDSSKHKDVIYLPSDAPRVISVSATGPLGWALSSSPNLNVVAFYSNVGLSTIDVAGPGGNIDFDLYTSGRECTAGTVTAPCSAFDMVLSTGHEGWYWSAGTGMAASYVSGVAALIIDRNGGSMSPAQVEQALSANALDLGKHGVDAAYGHGLAQADARAR